jgi:hypothetical protein
MKASVPIIVIAGVAGVWMGLVLVALNAVGVQIP